jgi:2-succinyl-5-enolpyruvyl-6-hydroxy-3-cyclohexene-1-carboxylate synthase
MPKTSTKKRAKPAVAEMSTAEATVATLIAYGLDTVYALPGVHNDHLFDAFQRAGEAMRVIHTRHEQGAAYMALGAALATGKSQAYAVVPGPGLLNSGAALLTAYSMNAPVLALGRPPSNARSTSGASATACRQSHRPLPPALPVSTTTPCARPPSCWPTPSAC